MPSLRATGPDLSGDLINRLNATLSHEIFRVAEPRCVNVALHDSLPSFGSYLAICVELVEYLSQHSRLKSESSGRSIRSHRTSTTNKDLTPTIRALQNFNDLIHHKAHNNPRMKGIRPDSASDFPINETCNQEILGSTPRLVKSFASGRILHISSLVGDCSFCFPSILAEYAECVISCTLERHLLSQMSGN
ncbi:uncharacterized protein CLUP02_04150 [Colletotrichum lupini]|uniref:Uncharacterized protein n=1 Tax=Colletotrichum lupini TaxID=145971 RepID=A0A9Q8SK53_9PEZI|nr:uncharacterized protein CLUP02_04150 [Colletotrichum lupini]UQC78673.1 hypothetical protein CLUP02_04150 [Colletotrichum lupini]